MLNHKKDTTRILLLEDNAADAELITGYLNASKLDFSMVTTTHLAEGMKILQSHSFDFILLDLELSDSHGIEALHTIKAACSEEVIIVLTGDDVDERLPVDALHAGAQDYIFKTQLSSETLHRSIRCAFERASLTRSLEAKTAEMQHRETLLHRIFDTNVDAMLILDVDCEIKFLNPAAAKLLEAEAEQLVGEIFPFEVKGGDATELEVPDADNRTRFFELSAVDLIWEGEHAMLVVLRDITRRRKAELALKRERTRLFQTLDSITEAAIASDITGAVERLNEEAARLLGVTNEDAIGQPLGKVLRLKNSKTNEWIEDPTKTLLETEFAEAFAKPGLPLERSDGEILHVSAQTCCVLDDEGERHGCVTLLHDISMQKKAEDELFKAEKLSSISLLAGGIAHDFNNMLTAILGNISMVRLDLDKDSKHSIKLIAAEKAAMQARSLTQQLLKFSKGGAPVLELTSIAETVEESAQFILRGSNVKCVIEKDDDLWRVDADKGQISQVVNNLIINADQSMPEGGIITVRLSNRRIRQPEDPSLNSGDYVCIEVCDEGTGISPDTLKRIFDPYFTTKENGNGLGLASSYSIIKSHRGSISAESTLGEGSVFRFYLPKSTQSPLPPAKRENNEKEDPSKENIHCGKGRILVMDDMEAMMLVAGEILKVLGYEVEYTTNGEEAIAAYKAAKEGGTPFEAVVFDLTVPGGMGGEEAANILKEYDPQLTAIASSGYTTSNVMSDYKGSAFKAVVPKPYRIKEMSDALHSLLESS